MVPLVKVLALVGQAVEEAVQGQLVLLLAIPQVAMVATLKYTRCRMVIL